MTHHTTDPHAIAHLAQRKAIQARKRRLQRQARLLHQHATAQASPTLTPASPTQHRGHQAESLALAHVQAAGLRLIARNLRCRAGELDLVCLDDDILVFIEVRTRQHLHYGGAAASVDLHKQQRLIRAAQYWLPRLQQYLQHYRPPACRFDVITLGPDQQLVWHPHAFTLNTSHQ